LIIGKGVDNRLVGMANRLMGGLCGKNLPGKIQDAGCSILTTLKVIRDALDDRYFES